MKKIMKKAFIFNLLLLLAQVAQAQEVAAQEATPFWQDKTFLLLVGGAVFLIILLIVKKIMNKRAYQEKENYEDSDL